MKPVFLCTSDKLNKANTPCAESNQNKTHFRQSGHSVWMQKNKKKQQHETKQAGLISSQQQFPFSLQIDQPVAFFVPNDKP